MSKAISSLKHCSIKTSRCCHRRRRNSTAKPTILNIVAERNPPEPSLPPAAQTYPSPPLYPTRDAYPYTGTPTTHGYWFPPDRTACTSHFFPLAPYAGVTKYSFPPNIFPLGKNISKYSFFPRNILSPGMLYRWISVFDILYLFRAVNVLYQACRTTEPSGK